jgi:peptidoglycan/LPS O-acetylase OafA/YrhL
MSEDNAVTPVSRSRPDQSRLSSLDGLRGLAAMSVVGEHCFLVFPIFWAAFSASPDQHGGFPFWVQALTYSPLKLLWAGGPAVAIFFVLSGLVLSLPFWSGRPQTYRVYVIRRIFRLVPVYLLALAFSLALYLAAGPLARPEASAWTGQAWHGVVSVTDIVRAVFFMPGRMLLIDGPLWTLIHEMRISLIYPLLLLAMRRWPWPSLVASLAISLAALWAGRHLASMPDLANVMDTVSQVWLFVAGGLIARNLQWLRARLESLSTIAVVGAVAVCAVLLAARFTFPLPEIVSYFATRGGAIALVILTAVDRRLAGLLAARLPLFLGAISYTVYALHSPILFTAMVVLPSLPLWVVVPGAVALSIAVAYAMTLLIEVPLIGIGRRRLQLGKPQLGFSSDRPSAAYSVQRSMPSGNWLSRQRP